jgi:hypothetical protein
MNLIIKILIKLALLFSIIGFIFIITLISLMLPVHYYNFISSKESFFFVLLIPLLALLIFYGMFKFSMKYQLTEPNILYYVLSLALIILIIAPISMFFDVEMYKIKLCYFCLYIIFPILSYKHKNKNIL